jgi:hypothetical protein
MRARNRTASTETSLRMPYQCAPDMTGTGVTESGIFDKMCPHCGATATRGLGECSVCHRPVCEKCGNVQFCQGERRVTHTTCLRKSDGGFKMIKFVG